LRGVRHGPGERQPHASGEASDRRVPDHRRIAEYWGVPDRFAVLA
jgi:hypothetical protein